MASTFQELLYLVAHEAPGGVPALAARMEKNPTVMQHKLNPNNTTHNLSPTEVETILDFNNANARAAQYFADKSDKLLIDKIVITGSDMELLDGYMDVVKELGEFSSAMQAAYADGRIDLKEFKKIAKEGNDVMAKMAGLINRIEHMVIDD